MHKLLLLTLLTTCHAQAALAPGDHVRDLTVDGRARSYLLHVPPKYDPAKATPVVLAFHGALMNGKMMVAFCGMSDKADAANFVVAYPDGTGLGEGGVFNAWADPKPAGEGPADDVKFTAALLDDLATVINVDAKRVFATGMSNGGMMCHRLAAELPDRIAAVAAVGGTIAMPAFKAPKRGVPVMQIHGTADAIVPPAGPGLRTPPQLKFLSVAATVKAWVDANGCPATPASVETTEDKSGDGTTIRRTTYTGGRDGSEVVLIEVEGGGHTWPGRPAPFKFLGKSTANLSANDAIWAFFERHPMK